MFVPDGRFALHGVLNLVNVNRTLVRQMVEHVHCGNRIVTTLLVAKNEIDPVWPNARDETKEKQKKTQASVCTNQELF